MNLQPLISVIVPNYNHARFLNQRLQTVFNQSYTNFEVIILDDHSTDESIQVIDLFKSNVRLSGVFLNEKNSGASIIQWKKGIEKAKGEWIWLAESDDYCNVNFLERMVQGIIQYPDCGIIYCQSTDVDENGTVTQSRINYTTQFNPNIWKNSFFMEGQEFIRKYQKVKNVIPNASAVLFKKSLTEDSNIWDASLLGMRYAADWLIWSRFLMKTNIYFIAENLNYFREHMQSTRVHDQPSKLERRVQEEILVRNELQNNFPDLEQDEEWELIYSKWFSIQTKFPYFKAYFYTAKKGSLGYWGYIRKFRLFQKKQKNNKSKNPLS